MTRRCIKPGIGEERVAMVGDTLPTDILGGAASGFRTALIQDYGHFYGAYPADAIATSGVVLFFILDRR